MYRHPPNTYCVTKLGLKYTGLLKIWKRYLNSNVAWYKFIVIWTIFFTYWLDVIFSCLQLEAEMEVLSLVSCSCRISSLCSHELCDCVVLGFGGDGLPSLYIHLHRLSPGNPFLLFLICTSFTRTLLFVLVLVAIDYCPVITKQDLKLIN